MALKISLREALGHYVQRAKEWGLSPIPDAERLEIVLGRMRDDVAQKRLAYQESLSAVVAIRDPEHPDRGQLPALRQRLEKYQNKGAEWGAEYKATSPTSRKRRSDLIALMQETSVNVKSVEREIASLEKVLATRQETLVLREKAYREAKANYQLLKAQGPSLIAQTKALEEAQVERARAIEASAAVATTDAGAILVDLEEALEEAQADERAAQLIEEGEAGLSLDEIIAAEEESAAKDETIAAWIE